MHISHVAAECAPLIKVGGLADVVFGLSRQLVTKGHTVEVILPYYKTIDKTALSELTLLSEDFHNARIWQAKMYGICITLIDPLHHDYYKRDNVYGYKDDLLRFGTFSLISHQYLLKKESLDVVHLHDWHTALIAFLNNHAYYPTLYTIHNLSYMGECRKRFFSTLRIDQTRIESIKQDGCYNIMKAGLLYADQITSVSKSYVEEIIYTTMGESLQPTLLARKEKIIGIVNGIDKDFWDPAKDPYLPYNFSLTELNNKKRLKEYVKKQFRIESEKDFLACSITRLVPQKGPELIIEAIKEVVELGGSYILLGSAQDPAIEAQFIKLKKEIKNSHALHLELVYDEKLSHLVYGASDLFVMPSIFEPCGLTQLIALQYGNIPLVRETGGLKDTVFEGINGFTFEAPKGPEIRKAVKRAFALWESNPTAWAQLIQTAMQEDHSWQKSTDKYLSLYEEIKKKTIFIS